MGPGGYVDRLRESSMRLQIEQVTHACGVRRSPKPSALIKTYEESNYLTSQWLPFLYRFVPSMAINSRCSGEDTELGRAPRVASFRSYEEDYSEPNSLRTSLEDPYYYQKQDCIVRVYDDESFNDALRTLSNHSIHNLSLGRIFRDANGLKECLNVSNFAIDYHSKKLNRKFQDRNPKRTRWM
ncbi:MAG: hypothetical protein Q9205_004119 [Flavoplaca limonia]